MGDVNDHSELMNSFREPDGHSATQDNGEASSSSAEGNPDEEQYLNLIQRIISFGKF